jgi:hypothetical protein
MSRHSDDSSDVKIELNCRTKVYHARFEPALLGATGWGTVRTSGAVIRGSKLGRGSDFEESVFFSGLRQVFSDGADWRTTRFYAEMTAKIRNGESLWNCRTEEAFLQRLEVDVRGIYDSMNTYGFLTQEEIIEKAADGDMTRLLSRYMVEYHTPPSAEHEIKVVLNEVGDILLIDGRHRLAIAKILGVPSIPVSIAARHETWANFRQFVKKLKADECKKGSIRLTHPDLCSTAVNPSALAATLICAEQAGIPKNSIEHEVEY